MGFADGDSLLVRIRIAFGATIGADPATWTWTDVTSYWHVDDAVEIVWGRSSGAEQAEPSTLSLTLKNTDGRFTALDPRSPYWPHVKKWTPIQYDVDLGDGIGWRNRFSGFVRKWPLTWPGRSPALALARIEAVGILGRLGRGKPPVRSAMRRTLAGSGALAYWPAEDGTVSTQVASVIPGVNALAVTGTVAFVPVDQINVAGSGAGFDRYGTLALLDLAAGGSLSATVPAAVTSATATSWTVHAVARVDVTLATANVVVMEWDTPGGTHARWQLVLTTSSRTQVIAYTSGGTATTIIDLPSVTTSFTVWDVSATQNGANIDIGLRWDAFSGAYTATGSVAGTLAGISGIRVNPTRASLTSDELPIGHIAIWGEAPMPYQGMDSVFDAYGVSVRGPVESSWDREAAHVRLVRLCTEDGVPLTIPAVDEAGVTRMGFQKAGAQLDLYREVEAADQGLMYEDGFGLGYLPRADRYNADIDLTIDASLRQLSMPFEPVDDDQALRNVWTVSRVDGSSAVAIDQESIDSQGEIEGTATVNLSSDGPLANHAALRLRRTTVQEPRYPQVTIDLGINRSLTADWCDCHPGSRINIINPPEQNRPGTVDQVIVGAAETYRGRRSWKVTLNVEPASPWDVAEVDGDQRVAADGSTLAADLTSSGTSFTVTSTTANGPWVTGNTITNPTDFPLLVNVGGEQIRVSEITGGTSPQTFTVDTGGRAVNGVTKSHSAGAEVDVWNPAIVPL